MKNLSKIFMLLAAVLISAFSASATTAKQSADDIAVQMVAEMAKTLNTPMMKKAMMQEAELSAFSASAQGKVLVLNMTTNDATIDFSELSASEKKELTSMFGEFLKQGITEGDEEVLEMLNMLGVKFKINFKDKYGHTLTSGTIAF